MAKIYRYCGNHRPGNRGLELGADWCRPFQRHKRNIRELDVLDQIYLFDHRSLRNLSDCAVLPDETPVGLQVENHTTVVGWFSTAANERLRIDTKLSHDGFYLLEEALAIHKIAECRFHFRRMEFPEILKSHH